MSTLQEYKSSVLARPDVVDIIKIEAVERQPVKAMVNGRQEITGYQEVEHTVEGSGRKMKKFDVHILKQVQVKGQTVNQFVTEPIAIYDKGTPTEEVIVLTVNNTADRIVGRLERYIKSLPYLNVEDIAIDEDAKTATFQALKDNGDGTAKAVEIFVYTFKKDKASPVETKHVEVIR